MFAGLASRHEIRTGSFREGASQGANRYRLPLGSFGLGASRGANRYRLPLGSFGLGASGRANRYRLPLGSFGLGASGRANRYSLPLGSFGREGRRPDPCFLDQTIHNLHFTQFSWFRRSSGRRQPSGRRSVPIATEPREMTIQDTIGDGASAFLASYRPASVSLGTLGYPRTHGFLGSRMGADESIRSSCYKFMC
jgi:hypothetical protein